jgi:hypothetical protein
MTKALMYVFVLTVGLGFGPVCVGGETAADPKLVMTGISSASPAGAQSVLPASVDLRPVFDQRGLVRRTQGKRNTCSVFTVVGALEFAAARQQHHGERLSVEFLNWAANRIVGENRDGGFFSDLWRGYGVYGICPEKSMPYRARFDPALAPTPEALAEAKQCLALGLEHHWIKEWDVKTGLTEEQFSVVKRTLAQGWPVCAGLRWPSKPEWSHGVLQMCPADAVYDGHSVLLVGYRDNARQPGGGTFLFRNSSNGGRDGAMPYIYARTYMNDALWIECPAKE